MSYGNRRHPITDADIADVFSRAIMNIAVKEFNLLKSGMSDEQVADNIINGHQNLIMRLRRLEMPNYKSWQTLLYLINYQPTHINLAYTMLRDLLKEDIHIIRRILDPI